MICLFLSSFLLRLKSSHFALPVKALHSQTTRLGRPVQNSSKNVIQNVFEKILLKTLTVMPATGTNFLAFIIFNCPKTVVIY